MAQLVSLTPNKRDITTITGLTYFFNTTRISKAAELASGSMFYFNEASRGKVSFWVDENLAAYTSDIASYNSGKKISLTIVTWGVQTINAARTVSVDNIIYVYASVLGGAYCVIYYDNGFENIEVTVNHTMAAVLALANAVDTASYDLYQGVVNCSTNPNYSASTKNQYWLVSVAGKIGGASGVIVDVGDTIHCIADSGAGDHATVGANFFISEHGTNRAYVITGDDAKTISVDENVDSLASCITLANALKATYNVHLNDQGVGGEEHIAQQTVVSTVDATDLATVLALAGALLSSYDDPHDSDAELGANWVYHQAQGGEASLTSAVTPTNLTECITRLNDMKAKLNTHMADGTAHTAGDSPAEAETDAAVGVTASIVTTGALASDYVMWSILDDGTGSVTGVSAVAGTDAVVFTFSADPQGDTIISYMVARPAVA